MFQHTHTSRRRRSAFTGLAVAALAVSACGGDDDTPTTDPSVASERSSDIPSETPSETPSDDVDDESAAGDDSEAVDDDSDSGDSGTEVSAGAAFPDERCAANEAAGTITFLTGFDFAAASSIVEVINADTLGYYDELCLDVEIQSSFSTANYPLVAGGQGQFASGGSFSEVLAFADANAADLVAVTVAASEPIDTLILKPGVAEELGDLEGATIGVKGKLPSSLEVMLLEAGLTAEDDYETVLLEGFDPTAHIAIESIVGFPGWRSNEPGRLTAESVEFVQFDAADSDIPGSFGAIFTTQGFIDEHPTAAEDFVRATLHGLASAIDDPKAAAAAAVELVEANGNPNFLSPEGEVFRWETEAAIISGATPDGLAPGTPQVELLQAEIEVYHALGLFGPASSVPDTEPRVDASLAAAVTADDGTIIWPG